MKQETAEVRDSWGRERRSETVCVRACVCMYVCVCVYG
jgi:hypothetical protein